jgi:hypothetical protein
MAITIFGILEQSCVFFKSDIFERDRGIERNQNLLHLKENDERNWRRIKNVTIHGFSIKK